MNTTDIDIGLARYSDWAFTSCVVVLVGALLLLAVELAYSRSRKIIEREAVGAGVGPGAGPGAGPGIVAEKPRRSVDERIGGAGLALAYLGIGAAVGLHRAARPGHRARAVGQHVRVHQPDVLLGPGGRRRRAPPSRSTARCGSSCWFRS